MQSRRHFYIIGSDFLYGAVNKSGSVEENIRQLDKLVDELAKGKPMEKILR